MKSNKKKQFKTTTKRYLARATRRIVMRAVTRTEVAVEVADVGLRHAAEVRADANHDEPIVFACSGTLHSLSIIKKLVGCANTHIFAYFRLSPGLTRASSG